MNRGWNLSGGVDLVAWLRRRFPGYHLVYGPMNGPLWGNVILSRYPVAEWGTYPYARGASDFPRGLVWAWIETEAGDLLFISTHLSAYAGFDADRAREAAELVDFWNRRPRTVIAGDFNARPGEPAIARVLAAGLRDIPAARGLGEAFTYSAGDPYERIDYVFASPDVVPVAADVPATLASDHLPVLVTVRLQPDGTRLTPVPGSR
ncbi:MAG: endonuclease/exonuclease/phosphatase family protein [Firmicutes bacterium]|nr:endonuclease/exonuclease/phosphatase family protein [Bacillota bacterium]